MMSEKPILFNTAMVKAIIDGRKTQTRRLVNKLRGFGPITEFQPSTTRGYDWQFRNKAMLWNDISHQRALSCLPYQVGDMLWVRESIGKFSWPEGAEGRYVADGSKAFDGWHYSRPLMPSIHMPRWGARLFLEVTGVRLERLQNISEVDVRAEGLKLISKDHGITWKYGMPDDDGLPGEDNLGWEWNKWKISPIQAFRKLWNSINLKTAPWESNPMVAVYEFKKIGNKAE